MPRLNLHYFLALSRDHLAQARNSVLELPHVQCEVAHVVLELHDHLRVYFVVGGHRSGLVVNCLSSGVKCELSLLYYCGLVIVDLLDALDVVFPRRANHFNALVDFEVRPVAENDEVFL